MRHPLRNFRRTVYAMYVDLLTLYFISIGTLLASAAMTFWESYAHPARGKALRVLAAGYASLAAGCAVALVRHDLPGVTGAALSNLVILSGYLLILNGIALFRGQRYPTLSVCVLLTMAAVWVVGGLDRLEALWTYGSAFPIVLISALMAWEMVRCDGLRPFPARRIVILIAVVHALTYAARGLVMPWLVIEYGVDIKALASKLTMYEGALYSVLLPMTLLKLMREESHSHLLRESQTDYLTRLGNRRWFFEEGRRIIDAAGGGGFAVLAFDLDRFKAINDQYGHQTGDDVLKGFAEIAREALGHDAVLARIGGEEFVALLWGDDARRSEKLGAAVAIRFAGTISGRVEALTTAATVSIGLARFEAELPSLADALAAADRALYRAKSQGGNRLEMTTVAAVVSV